MARSTQQPQFVDNFANIKVLVSAEVDKTRSTA